MSTQFKKINDNSEMFLAPIPKWVTHYGFFSLMSIAALIITGIGFIKYPVKKNIDIVITQNDAFVLIDFETYKKLSTNQTINFTLPIIGKITGIIDPQSAVITGGKIRNRLIIPQINKKLNILDTLFCKGDVTLKNLSVLQSLITKENS